MTKKRASEAVIKGYIKLPKGVRRWTDPLVRGHAARAEKGKEKVLKKIKGKKR